MIINTQAATAKPLVNALKANGVFSLVSGAILVTFNLTFSQWFAQLNPLIIIGLGIGLMLFALRLLYLAGPSKLFLAETKLIIASDIGWVIGSLLLLTYFFNHVSSVGSVVAVMVSIVVAGFAFAQIKGLAKYQTNNE